MADRLIKEIRLIEDLYGCLYGFDFDLDDVVNVLRGVESVDAVPVVHAYWRSEGGKKARFCSHCNHDEPYKFADTETDIYAYCPHCGSRMDKKDGDSNV